MYHNVTLPGLLKEIMFIYLIQDYLSSMYLVQDLAVIHSEGSPQVFIKTAGGFDTQHTYIQQPSKLTFPMESMLKYT